MKVERVEWNLAVEEWINNMAKKINPDKVFKQPSKKMMEYDEVYRSELTHAVKVATKKKQTPSGCCYECEAPRPEIVEELKRQGHDDLH